MRAVSTIRAELGRTKRILQRGELMPQERDELLGVQQALAWVLGQDAMAPVQAAVFTIKKQS